MSRRHPIRTICPRELRAGHETLAATLRTLTPEQLTRPGVYADDNGDWTLTLHTGQGPMDAQETLVATHYVSS